MKESTDRATFKHSNGIEYEPVHSPEYIAYCEKNEHGYTMGVNTIAGLILHKTFQPERFFNFTHIPGFDTDIPRPYTDTLADGTYVTPEQSITNFLNKNAGLLIPKGDSGSEPLKLGQEFKG